MNINYYSRMNDIALIIHIDNSITRQDLLVVYFDVIIVSKNRSNYLGV